jgi:hypothetical protein
MRAVSVAEDGLAQERAEEVKDLRLNADTFRVVEIEPDEP